jgi:hypothetical protein
MLFSGFAEPEFSTLTRVPLVDVAGGIPADAVFSFLLHGMPGTNAAPSRDARHQRDSNWLRFVSLLVAASLRGAFRCGGSTGVVGVGAVVGVVWESGDGGGGGAGECAAWNRPSGGWVAPSVLRAGSVPPG